MDTATQLLETLRQQSMVLGCAESCTGGLLSGTFTDIPGCSDVFVLGQVTYADAAKVELLGIDDVMLKQHGAVSAEIAMAMAKAVASLARSLGERPALGISTTGVAGPDGSDQKPVGLVFVGIYHSNWPQARFQQYQFSGDRSDIRAQTITAALEFALEECLV